MGKLETNHMNLDNHKNALKQIDHNFIPLNLLALALIIIFS